MTLFKESSLTLAEAADIARVHVATIHRWISLGVNGVRLESYKLGQARRTTREALERFAKSSTEAADGNLPHAEVAAQ